MTPVINLTSNIDKVLDETSVFFWRQVPFALAQSINDSLFNARRQIVEVTWPKSFTVRNQRFANTLFRVDKITTGGKGNQLGAYRRGEIPYMRGSLKQVPDKSGRMREYVKTHATGGTKTPRGRKIAIPKHPATLRTPTGRVAKAKRPYNITKKRGVFEIKRGGSMHLILQRHGDTTSVIYHFKESVKIDKRFRFYEDAHRMINKTIGPAFETRFRAAVARSRSAGTR